MSILVWFNKWLIILTELGLLAAVLYGLVALLVKSVRRSFGIYLLLLSFGIGAATWTASALLVLGIWGITGFVIGVLLGGIGVVPLSLFATLLHREWTNFFAVIVQLICLFGTRYSGIAIVERDERRRANEIHIELFGK